ncbi:MAG TPA: DUF2933 domain-containing protein [Candidatus Binatia bacterium]|nr:DUF2933 domain-containing protein [Candidatus Binatia bacterium]
MENSLDRDGTSREVAGAPAGDRRGARAAYCAYCGLGVDQVSPTRFGEPFCGEEHAEAFAAEVRSARARSLALVDDGGTPDGGEMTASENRPDRGWNLRRVLTLGACCAIPILAAAILLGGGAALLGVGAAVLPYLALLACPIGMFFMMRAMQGRRDHGGTEPSESMSEREDARKGGTHG